MTIQFRTVRQFLGGMVVASLCWGGYFLYFEFSLTNQFIEGVLQSARMGERIIELLDNDDQASREELNSIAINLVERFPYLIDQETDDHPYFFAEELWNEEYTTLSELARQERQAIVKTTKPQTGKNE